MIMMHNKFNNPEILAPLEKLVTISDADGHTKKVPVYKMPDGSFQACIDVDNIAVSNNSPEEAVEAALNKLATKDQVWIVEYPT